MKTAVVLLNFGGPESSGDIRRYLYAVFNDPAVLSLPAGLRQMAATTLSLARVPETKRLYARLGAGPRLRQRTEEQARALEERLNDKNDGGETKCFVAMRYNQPSLVDTMTRIKSWRPDNIVFLPL